jgi:hypothetical protein
VGANPGGRLFGRGDLSRPSVYGKRGEEDAHNAAIPAEGRVVYGAGGYSVRVNPDGFVDLSAADAAMRDAQNRIGALEAALAQAGLEIPAAPQGRGRGGRGNGGYRGRGGRGAPNH